MPRDLEMTKQGRVPEKKTKSFEEYVEFQEDVCLDPTYKIQSQRREIKENPRDPNPNFTQTEEIECKSILNTGLS